LDITLYKTRRDVLRPNVGFILKENVGFIRQMDFEAPLLEVADDLDVSNFRGSISLTRTPQGVYVQGRFKGNHPGECDRCLTEVSQTLTADIKQLYDFPFDPTSEFSIAETGFLDLAPLVRELMLISAPIRTLCRPDCKGLCPNCGQNWNEGPCDCDKEEINPNFAVLKDLLKK
jgi:uncharacterized protein